MVIAIECMGMVFVFLVAVVLWILIPRAAAALTMGAMIIFIAAQLLAKNNGLLVMLTCILVIALTVIAMMLALIAQNDLFEEDYERLKKG